MSQIKKSQGKQEIWLKWRMMKTQLTEICVIQLKYCLEGNSCL